MCGRGGRGGRGSRAMDRVSSVCYIKPIVRAAIEVSWAPIYME